MGCPNIFEKPKILGTLLSYVMLYCFLDILLLNYSFYFYVINMVNEEACEKRSVNTISSSVLYKFIKKEENLRLFTIYKIKILHNDVPNIVPDGLLKLFQAPNFSTCLTDT